MMKTHDEHLERQEGYVADQVQEDVVRVPEESEVDRVRDGRARQPLPRQNGQPATVAATHKRRSLRRVSHRATSTGTLA